MIYIGFKISGESQKEMHECGVSLREYMLSSLFEEYSADDIEITSHGKPILKSGYAGFSVSHSCGAVCCAVNTGNIDCREKADTDWIILESGDDVDIGVDIEPVFRDVKWEKLAQRFFTKQEKAYALDKQRFIEIFTKKESLCKLSGNGIADMKNADTFLENDIKTVTKTVFLKEKEYKISVSFKNT